MLAFFYEVLQPPGTKDHRYSGVKTAFTTDHKSRYNLVNTGFIEMKCSGFLPVIHTFHKNSADTTGRDATPITRRANFQVVFCRCGPLLTMHEICCHQFNFRLIKMKFSDIHPEIYCTPIKRDRDYSTVAIRGDRIHIFTAGLEIRSSLIHSFAHSLISLKSNERL